MTYNSMENRKDNRELYPHPIYYVMNNDPNREVLSASTINISNTGACIFACNYLVKGEGIIITKGLPKSIPFQPCTVRWTQKIGDGLYKTGLMFNSSASAQTEPGF